MRPPPPKHASKYGVIKLRFRKRSRTLTYEQKGGYQSTVDCNGVSVDAHIHALYGLTLQRPGKSVLMIGCGGGTLGTIWHEAAGGSRLLKSIQSRSRWRSAILACHGMSYVM
ncbi:MAG TPA: hypothetical protein VGF61_00560 [Candidatus Acidoferrum sp.]